MAASPPQVRRVALGDELNHELARYIETEQTLGRFELREDAILVLDAADDARIATLIAALSEAIDAAPDTGAGRYLEMEVGPSRHRFRVLSGWEIPPTVHYVIGAGAILLRCEGSSRAM
jgi:hypothetical protein